MEGLIDMAGNSSFNYKAIMFALAIAMLLPLGINVFFTDTSASLNTDEALSGYYDFTGSKPAQESVWVLTGIYTPYGADVDGNEDLTHYGYTDDGWLYGSRVVNYTPEQYRGKAQQYTVTRQADGLYHYNGDTTYGDHKDGDLYTNVTMTIDKQSNIFFTPDLKEERDGYFYYEYDGFRYAFQPTASYKAINSDGENIDVVQNTSSLSLIWYNYYTSTGISGQLIISGKDMSVAYLTSNQIVSAFNSTTSTAKFTLNFTGIPMNIYVKIDPTYLAMGYSVQYCYDNGYWSVMVTSESADGSAYTGADYGLDPLSIWNTIVNLFTFHYEDYNISQGMGLLCSFLFVAPLYAMLLAICSESWQILVGAVAIGALQGITTFLSNTGVWSWIGGLFG